MNQLNRARLGRPGEQVDVRDGEDVDPATGQLLTVAELQVVLRAARARALPTLLAAAVPVAGCTNAAAVPRIAAPSSPAVGVVAAHAGAGASTVALAIADAAAVEARAVQLSEWCDPYRSGLASVTTSELGRPRDGSWCRGVRGAVVLDRRADQTWPTGWPAPVDAARLHVADLGQLGAGQLPDGLALVLVCRASVPGFRSLEQLLRVADAVAVAVVGPARWSGAVTATAGSRVRGLREKGQLVRVPIDRSLESDGLTAAVLPKSLLAAGRQLVALIDAAHPDGAGAVHRTAKGSTR